MLLHSHLVISSFLLMQIKLKLTREKYENNLFKKQKMEMCRHQICDKKKKIGCVFAHLHICKLLPTTGQKLRLKGRMSLPSPAVINLR
jgi:hypothetical protein